MATDCDWINVAEAASRLRQSDGALRRVFVRHAEDDREQEPGSSDEGDDTSKDQ